jgi:hypothetical protein
MWSRLWDLNNLIKNIEVSFSIDQILKVEIAKKRKEKTISIRSGY